MARANFIEVFSFPRDTLAINSTHGSSCARLVVGNVQESIVQHPVDSFSFGWLNKIAVSEDSSKPDSFQVVLEVLQSTHAPTLAFYRLEANPTGDLDENLPSPPLNADGSTSHSLSKTLLTPAPLSGSTSLIPTSSPVPARKSKLVLGHHRTALWLSEPGESNKFIRITVRISRQDYDRTSKLRGTKTWKSFVGDDLVWASFGPGQTQVGTRGDGDENRTRMAYEEDSKTFAFTRCVSSSCADVWTTIGYDEETGRVALGEWDGYITLLRL